MSKPFVGCPCCGGSFSGFYDACCAARRACSPINRPINWRAFMGMSRVRARIEHCSMLHDDQIARMKALGISASCLIGHVHFWGGGG